MLHLMFTMTSHTRSAMSMGNGIIQAASTKQKINSRSSTEVELTSNDDMISKVIWTIRFLGA
jgi:hypothetical protein